LELEVEGIEFPTGKLSASAISCGQSIGIIPNKAPDQASNIAHAKRARCVWNANPEKRAHFVKDVRELVSQMVIWQAVSTNENLAQAFAEPSNSVGVTAMKVMVEYLNQQKKPMALEDSLKRWPKGRVERRSAGKTEDASEKATKNKTADELLENTIVGIIQNRLIQFGTLDAQTPSSGSSSSSNESQETRTAKRIIAAIQYAVEGWLLNNVHPWEAEMH
jgi:hypothetical protein